MAVTTGAGAFHATGADGRGVDVALVDTGVAPVPALAGAVAEGVDLTPGVGGPPRGGDGFGHGTHLAGIITGRDGVAPGARVVSVKVADHRGATDLGTVVAGVDWVVRNRTTGGRDIRVLNLSFGVDAADGDAADALTAAVERAWRAGIVVVVAAGNGRAGAGLDHPATSPAVLAVGASDGRGAADPSDDVVAAYSRLGDARRAPDLVAPGTSVVGLRAPASAADRDAPAARVGADGFRGTGTSQAAAVVSAAAALVLSRSPDLGPDQVKALLTTSATPLSGAGPRAQGAGRLDLRRAAAAPVPAGTVLRGASTGAPVEPAALSAAVAWSGNRWSGNRWSSASWGT